MSARQQNNLTPTEMWPINTYWRESSKSVSQHWYTTFCLLMSVVQDYFTAMVLKQHGNLNWAVTCRYYSMVHTGRLLAFVTVGDFPKAHAQLRSVFLSHTENRTVRFDGRPGFARSNERHIILDKDVLFDDLCTLLDSTANGQGRRNTVESFGQALTALAELRNESNYEALLIAHEKQHCRVTELFERMERQSGMLAAKTVDLAIAAYLAYLQNHVILEKERPDHIAASNGHVHERLNLGITDKIAGCRQAKDKLNELAKNLTLPATAETAGVSVDDIENRIEMAHFCGKNTLFDSVEKNVSTLEQVDWPQSSSQS